MKKIMFSLFILTILFGVACKKNNLQPVPLLQGGSVPPLGMYKGGIHYQGQRGLVEAVATLYEKNGKYSIQFNQSLPAIEGITFESKEKGVYTGTLDLTSSSPYLFVLISDKTMLIAGRGERVTMRHFRGTRTEEKDDSAVSSLHSTLSK